MSKMSLTDIYRAFHPTVANHTFFSAAHGTFFKRHHILHHKANLNKYKSIEITPYILTDHNRNHWEGKPLKTFKLMKIE
jgi:hypothetical protein